MIVKLKKIIFIILFFIIVLVAVGGVWYFKKIQISKKENETPPEIPDITGVETIATIQPISKKDELINVLIDFSPVNEKRFSFRFSFKENKFIVTLKPEGEESYQAFIKWLKDGGFEEIPLDEFIIENR